MSTHGLVVVASWCLLLLPVAGAAQTAVTGSIAGVVRDTSGAVLPGVRVDAASPALIEKARTTVTDDQGRYRIVDLRPGVYAITLTLAGFTTWLHRAHSTVGAICIGATKLRTSCKEAAPGRGRLDGCR